VSERELGVRTTILGTVLAVNITQNGWGRYMLVKYGKAPGFWYDGATETLPQTFDAEVGEIVILEYVVTRNSGLWRVRKNENK
jgi:hypothetical protein